MYRDQLIAKGLELEKISDYSELCGEYEKWKADVLHYLKKNDELVEECRPLLHVMDVPYGTDEEKRNNYFSKIEKTIRFLKTTAINEEQEKSPLEIMVGNFGLYLQNMFCNAPAGQSTIKEEALRSISINNEYDLQHMMFAVIKSLYPSARKEVNQDTGYRTVRFDIVVEEIDTVIELKCTRADHSENKLFRELGEDGFFYKCSHLIIYVYDRYSVIKDLNNFIKALERTKEEAGKEIKVYVEQTKERI